jgi:hypothetical protein
LISSKQTCDYIEIHVNDYPEIPASGNYLAIWPNGKHMEYFVDGLNHREDGPAVLMSDGSTQWRQFGLLHRVGGPAQEWTDGGQTWAIDGKCHRLEGPAMINIHGDKYWFLNGVRMTYNEWRRERKPWLEQQRTQEIKDLVI